MKYYRIVNKDNKGEIIIDGVIGASFWEEGMEAKDFRADFKALEEKYDNIDIRIINSPGGSIAEGFAIFETISASEKNTTIYIDAIAASMAAVIAVSGDRLFMAKNAKMMLHKASGGAYGNSDDLIATAKLMEDYESDITERIVNKTGKSEDYVKNNWITKTDKWFNATEAKREGLIDGIYDGGQLTEQLQNVKKLNIAAYYNDKLKITEMENLKILLEAAGLNPDATESDLHTAIVKLKSDNEAVKSDNIKLKADLEKEKQEKTSLQNSQKEFTRQRAETLINNAVESGKLSFEKDEDKEAKIKEAEASYDVIKSFIDAIPEKKAEKKESLKSIFKKTGEQSNVEAKNELAKQWNELEKTEGALKALKDENPERYDELYKAKYK